MERNTRSRIFETILREDPSAAPRPKLPTPPPAHSPAQPPASAPAIDLAACRERAKRAEDHGDYQTAAAEFSRAATTGLSSPLSDVDRIELFLSLGRCQQHIHQFDEARLALQQAQHIIDSSPAPLALACQQVETNAHLGYLEFASGNVREAETHLIAAINRYEESCDVHPKRLARLYVALASVYAEASLLDHAMEMTLQGLTYLEDCPKPVDWEKMRMFQLLATIACKKDQREAAVRHLLEAYQFAGLLASQPDLVELEVLLATVYAQYGQDREACAWYQAAIRRQEVTGEQTAWPLSLLYLCLGQVQTRLSPEEAATTLLRSLDLQLSHLYLNPIPVIP